MRVPRTTCAEAGHGGFASRAHGEWRTHSSADAARHRAAGDPRGVAVTVTGDREGEPIAGRVRPYGNRSGKHKTKRRQIGGTDDQWAKLDAISDATGMPWADIVWEAVSARHTMCKANTRW